MPYQMIYSSKATEPMSAADLEAILDDARAGNEARDVTGALVYADGLFVQIIEGEEGVVGELMASIARDTRHERVKVFHQGEVPVRAFESWRMAYLAPSAQEMAAWAGLPGTETIDGLLARVHRDPRLVPRILLSIVGALASRAGRSGPG